MTIREFSDSFDTLVNSFSREIAFVTDNSDIAFNEYEKSVFLTKAQEQLVISLYNGKNSNEDSFESSEEMRRYLEPLVTQKEVENINRTITSVISSYSYKVSLESNVMFIIYEGVDWNINSCLPKTNIQVQPITHDEYHKIKNNPFRGPNDHRVLRLDDSPNSVELISKYPIGKYIYRYLRKPKPIILENLSDGLSLGNNETSAQTSELNDALHERILELAVQLGLQSRGINNNQGAR